ncbi:MAG: hypothetical protein ACC656_06775, partial [Candidatus Heimdallarchaeota archaeon]
FNSSKMNTIYLALNKLEFDLKASILGNTINLGHVNGSAPFQTLMQYFNVLDRDVFIANTFRGYLAYETTPTDPTLGPGDDVYLGYTMVETNFINFLNGVFGSKLAYTIPDYGFEPLYTNTDTEKSFGMNYTNFFVVWQDVKPAPVDALNAFDNNFDQVVTGKDIVAASVFEYLTFTYKIVETKLNATHTKVDVITEYDVGPMKLLITRDDATRYGLIEGFLSSVTDGVNSFNTAAQDITINLKQYDTRLPNPTISIPSLSFYTGDAVTQRIDASAVLGAGATGFGLAIATSTNVIVVGENVEDHEPLTDAQDSVIPLNINGNSIYETSFEGKSTYDRTLNNGTVETGLPIYISTRSPSELSSFIDFGNVASDYFKAQSLMTNGLAVLSARELNPDRFGSILGPGDLNLRVDQTKYVTFVQMPQWSGLEVTQDPTFSAVAAVPQKAGDSTDTSNGGDGKSSEPSGVPGFEFYAMILIVIPLAIKRKYSKK